MSSGEGQLQPEAMVNGAREEAASRIFAVDPIEGEALWCNRLTRASRSPTRRPKGRKGACVVGMRLPTPV
jgi:hypothetical protein